MSITFTSRIKLGRLAVKLNPARNGTANQQHSSSFARLTIALGAAMALSAATTGQAAEPMKAAFIYVGPVGDHGWSYAHDQSRLKTEAAFKGTLKTSYVEKVPETADAERVLRTLAQQGNQVIFATSYGYMNAMTKVARQFPAITFMHATGYKTGPNLGTYDVRTYEGAYMLGVIAGHTSKTGKLGVVGSFQIPEVVRNINAFTLGARSVNPKATTRVIWVNSWFDPGKERDAALALIAQGSDTLMQNTDSPAVVQAAQQKGVYAFGWNSDMSKFGPKAQLAASVLHWEPIYSKTIKDVASKTWKPTPMWWGVAQNTVNLEAFGPGVPAQVRSKALAVREAIRTGRLHPFTGPIADQTGKVVLPAGRVFTDAALSKMNFYVQGVESSLTK